MTNQLRLMRLIRPKTFLLLLSAITISSCENHNHSNEHEHDYELHEATEGHDHHDEIVMSPEDARRFGVTVEAAEPSDFIDMVKAIGEILPSSTDLSVVSAPTSGIITFSNCTEIGEKVTSGHLIATISSADVSGGDVNKTYKANLEAAKRELDRITPLVEEGIVSRKEYNEVLNSYETAKAGFSAPAASGKVSAINKGIISSITVNNGSYVEVGQPIATVSGDSKLTLKALLPAKYASFLPLISSANIRPSYGGDMIDLDSRSGRLLSSSIASSTSPAYIPVYFSFENRGDIMPGSAVEVYLKGSTKSQAISLPKDAISEQQGEKFIYVKVDEHAYRKQNIATGRDNGERVEILSGLAPGDSVVTAGSTFIRIAETSTVVPEGHSHNH